MILKLFIDKKIRLLYV